MSEQQVQPAPAADPTGERRKVAEWLRKRAERLKAAYLSDAYKSGDRERINCLKYRIVGLLSAADAYEKGEEP